MDVIKFIKCVQQRDCIYNKNSADYRQRETVFDSWRNIAREMNINVIECKEKWHNLRSNYMRERKKILGPGLKKWHLLDALRFLEPHHCIRNNPKRKSRKQSIGNFQPDVIHEIDDFEASTPQNVTSTEQFNFDIPDLHNHHEVDQQQSQEHNVHLGNERMASNSVEKFDMYEIADRMERNKNNDMTSEEREEAQCDVEISSQRSHETKYKRQRRTSRRLKWKNVDYEYLKHVRRLSRQLNQPSEDPDRMFLLSLLPVMKRLTPKDNLDFRVQVQQILQDKLD